MADDPFEEFHAIRRRRSAATRPTTRTVRRIGAWENLLSPVGLTTRPGRVPTRRFSALASSVWEYPTRSRHSHENAKPTAAVHPSR